MKIWPTALALAMVLALLVACSPQSAGSQTPVPTTSPTATASPTLPPSSSAVQTISAQELKEKLDRGERLVLIDLRSQSQFATGHIQGALDIPEPELAGRSLDLPLDSQVIVYVSCA